MTRPEAELFFEKYYSPGNLTIAIVGDVNPTEVREPGPDLLRSDTGASQAGARGDSGASPVGRASCERGKTLHSPSS